MRKDYFRTENMSVGYNGKPLINGINISIKKGDILSLIGPNGSGKSTILKSITKHLAMIAGVVYIDKNDLKSMSGIETAKKISVVLTERIKPELMTCRDVVETGRYPYTNYFGKLTEKDNVVVTEALEQVDALELQNESFNNISDGQKQRVLLARAICQQPKIIVLDEPTSFLDIKYKIELLGILRSMAKEKNITVIMSLHEIDLAAKISDIIVCVKGDTISRFGTPEEIFRGDVINELYGLKNGSYNIVFGSVELAKPEGEPEIFVLGGGGSALGFYRILQKNRTPFFTGVLHRNDIDFQVARDLAEKVVSEKPFQPVSEQNFGEAVSLISRCKYVLNAKPPVGSANKKNLELIDEAKRLGVTVTEKIEDIV